MTTIFEAIRADHDTQRRLIELLEKTEGDSEGRRELWDRLKAELEAHAGAEERHFYIPLMEHDLTQEHARHSIAEHHELDEAVAELDATLMSSPQWLRLAKELGERLRHHLDEEEAEIFPVAGKALSDAEKDELAEHYRDDLDRRLETVG